MEEIQSIKNKKTHFSQKHERKNPIETKFPRHSNRNNEQNCPEARDDTKNDLEAN